MSLSPKLLKSLHNQLYTAVSVKDGDDKRNCDQELVLRKIQLSLCLTDILSYCKPCIKQVVLLDVSFSILDSGTIATMCQHFHQLRSFYAKSCKLTGSLNNVTWPILLKNLDLSRNRLESCPQGIFQLMHLKLVNLSGNCISSVPLALLKLPNLNQCLFLNNPLKNVPKEVCREGVYKMRSYFSVNVLPSTQYHFREQDDAPIATLKMLNSRSRSNSNSEYFSNLPLQLLQCYSSIESDYESCLTYSPNSISSNDTEFSDCGSQVSAVSDALKPSSVLNHIPDGYRRSQANKLCEVYLPEDCKEHVKVRVVKDLSMYPELRDNELLVTPVMRVTPHGMKFNSEPAIIVLPHCSKRIKRKLTRFIPICSNTAKLQVPLWSKLDSCSCSCLVDDSHVLFSTFHFSLFAVIMILTYPSSSLTVQPRVGGSLLVPELPGFQLNIPNSSVSHLTEPVTIRSTVHFCDRTYNASDTLAPASACIKFEPHGLRFHTPVEVVLPLPNYVTITQHFPEVRVELWTSQQPLTDFSDIPDRWEPMKDADIYIENSGYKQYQLARFKIEHFSFFEFLLQLSSSSLQALRLGAQYFYNNFPGRERHIFVRYQVFISSPLNQTFGLLVAIFKFGDPLTELSNYPILVADSGVKRVSLLVGPLHLQLTGHFLPSNEIGDKLEREGRIVDFTGEDFCERFEFALRLSQTVAQPLQPGLLLGQIYFTQQDRSTTCNLIIPHPTVTTSMVPMTSVRNFCAFADDFTPPRSPELKLTESSHQAEATPHVRDYSTNIGKQRRKRSLRSEDTLYSPQPTGSSAKRRILLSTAELNDRDLLNISLQCNSKYLELGLHLGLDYQTINNRVSRHEGKGDHLKAFEVLQEWKGRDFNISALAHALETVGHHHLAQQYCYNEVPG